MNASQPAPEIDAAVIVGDTGFVVVASNRSFPKLADLAAFGLRPAPAVGFTSVRIAGVLA